MSTEIPDDHPKSRARVSAWSPQTRAASRDLQPSDTISIPHLSLLLATTSPLPVIFETVLNRFLERWRSREKSDSDCETASVDR
jgi:hypothetical protein